MKSLCRGSNQIISIKRLVCCFSLAFVLGMSPQLWAGDLVAARYTKLGGQEVIAEISVDTPPPSTLIIIQTIPARTSVVTADPTPKNVNGSNGEVKWLLMGGKPGTRSIRMSLDKPVSAPDISGEVRYRDPVSGAMAVVPIAKP